MTFVNISNTLHANEMADSSEDCINEDQRSKRVKKFDSTTVIEDYGNLFFSLNKLQNFALRCCIDCLYRSMIGQFIVV